MDSVRVNCGTCGQFSALVLSRTNHVTVWTQNWLMATMGRWLPTVPLQVMQDCGWIHCGCLNDVVRCNDVQCNAGVEAAVHTTNEDFNHPDCEAVLDWHIYVRFLGFYEKHLPALWLRSSIITTYTEGWLNYYSWIVQAYPLRRGPCMLIQ